MSVLLAAPNLRDQNNNLVRDLIQPATSYQDCEQPFFKEKFKRVYWVSFFMAILWIAVLCESMVCVCAVRVRLVHMQM